MIHTCKPCDQNGAKVKARSNSKKRMSESGDSGTGREKVKRHRLANADSEMATVETDVQSTQFSFFAAEFPLLAAEFYFFPAEFQSAC